MRRPWFRSVLAPLVAAAALIAPASARALPGSVDFGFFRGDVRVMLFGVCDDTPPACWEGRVEVGRRRAAGAGESVWAVRVFAEGRLTDDPATASHALVSLGNENTLISEFTGTPWGDAYASDFPEGERFDSFFFGFDEYATAPDRRSASASAVRIAQGDYQSLYFSSLFAATPSQLQVQYVTQELGEDGIRSDGIVDLGVTGDRIERDPTLSTIPEPGTVALLGAGLAGVAGLARRRRAASA